MKTAVNAITDKAYPVNEIRELLKEFIDYRSGERIRKQLHEYANSHYVSQHSDAVYMLYLNTHACTFTVNGAQSTNHPYYYTLFSVPSQHVMGDCVKECLDNAINKTNQAVLK